MDDVRGRLRFLSSSQTLGIIQFYGGSFAIPVGSFRAVLSESINKFCGVAYVVCVPRFENAK